MDAGRLRERVTIEAEVRKANGQGGYVTEWVPVGPIAAAEIVGLSGDEALRLGVERSSSQFRVTMRKRLGLTSSNRLIWSGQVMAIRSVLPHPREPQQLQLLICEIGFGS